MIKTLKTMISRNRILASIVLAVPCLFLAKPNLLSLSVGLPIVLFGEAIRVYASGYIHKDKEITTDGPYALTRNPLYLGNLFLGLGFSIALGNVFIPFVFVIVFFFIYHATMKREEAFLWEKFGESYARYKADTPRFFPSLSAFKNKMRGTFSWDLVKKHREYNTWVGIIVVISLLLIVRMLTS